jgi:site-specific recombinase XerD
LPDKTEAPQTLARAIEIFTGDKRNQGVSGAVLKKYNRELERFRVYCEGQSIFVVSGITLELLSGYRSNWPDMYPSTITRARVQARLKTFLRFCYDAKYLDRIPKMSPIKEDEVPTLPLTNAEYKQLLATIPKAFTDVNKVKRVHALVQLMRWSGLSIRDAVTLERNELIQDKKKKFYRIVTARQKTGTHVSVPIPAKIADEVLAVLNGNPRYVFWSGNGQETTALGKWHKDIADLFREADIEAVGSMLSHRLRDTFAVDLLEKGVPLEEVSKLLGHESIKTTEKSYAKWVKGRQDRLDKLVMGTW